MELRGERVVPRFVELGGDPEVSRWSAASGSCASTGSTRTASGATGLLMDLLASELDEDAT